MEPSAIIRLILSGGIGSGKSTVGRLLARRGAVVIDADRAGHAVLEPGGEAWAAVAERWPDVVVDGRIDRSLLGRIVFADPDQLAELEGMTHPAIRRRIQTLVEGATGRVVVVELPLASEFLGPAWARAVVVAPAAVRRARLVERGMEGADIEWRMAAQPDDAAWEAGADFVIHNRGTLQELEDEIDRVWGELTRV